MPPPPMVACARVPTSLGLLLALALLPWGSGCGGSGKTPADCMRLGTAVPLAFGIHRRLPQVEIQVRFIGVGDTFIDDLGLDLDILCDIVSDPSALPGGTNGQGEAFGAGADVVGGADGTVSYVPANQRADALLSIFAPGGVSPFNAISVFLGLPGPGCIQVEPALVLPVQGGAPGLAGTTLPAQPVQGGDQIATTFLSPTQLAAVLLAAQQRPSSTLLSAPHVVTYTGQPAHFLVNNVTATTAEIEPAFANVVESDGPPNATVHTGMSLNFVPHISQDLSYVRLDVHPEMSIADFESDQTLGIGSRTGPLVVPVIRAGNVTMTVSVPDGGTDLLGGFVKKPSSVVQFGLPMLSKLPFLGSLVGRTKHIHET